MGKVYLKCRKKVKDVDQELYQCITCIDEEREPRIYRGHPDPDNERKARYQSQTYSQTFFKHSKENFNPSKQKPKQ